MIVVYIVNLFINHDVLMYICGVLAILALGLSFNDASRLFKVIGFMFIITGVSLYIYTGTPWRELPYFMVSTLPLLAMLAALPFINSMIIVGRYDQSINKLLKARVDHLGLLYPRSVFATYVLTSFLNISTIPLVQSVLKKNLSHQTTYVRQSFISRTVLRGFALALAWSPMEVLVAVTVDVTGVTYFTLLPWLMLFSFTLLAVESVKGLFYRKYALYETGNAGHEGKRNSPSVTAASSGSSGNKPAEGNEAETEGVDRDVFVQIGILFVALLLFVLCIIGVVSLLDVQFLIAVTLVIIPYSFAWAFVIKRWHTYSVFGFKTWKRSVNHLQNFVVLFLSLGFFVSILSETVFLDYMQIPFLVFSESPVLILIMIQLIYLILAMLGIHPLATIGIMAEVIQPLLGTINPLSIAIVLVTGGLPTASVGPYGLSVNMVGQLTDTNPFRITGWNMVFALTYGGFGVFIAALLL